MKLDIKPYMPGDEEGIVSLLNDVFKDWPKQDIEVPPVEYWKWKYLENPLKRMLVVTAQDEGIIIGCHHDIPLRINVEGEIWNCSYTADLAVDEKYRGEGVSTMMRSYKEEKVKTKEKLSYFITSNLDLIEKFSKIFHQFPVKIVNYVYINDINTHLRKRPVNNPYLVRVGFKLFRSLGKLRTKMVDYSGNGIGDVKLTEEGTFGEEINRLWEKLRQYYDFIVMRDDEYLRWKYCDDRAGNFKIIKARRDDEVVGYITLIINDYYEDYPVGYIADLITLTGEKHIANKLIEESIRYFEEKNVNLVNLLSPEDHYYTEVLRKNGFINSRIGLNIFYQKLRDNRELFFNKNNPKILLSWGDLDVFPVEIPKYSPLSRLII